VANALAAGFVEALTLKLERGDLSAFELAAATRLQERYASYEWTFLR
jgi:hypothetical protein